MRTRSANLTLHGTGSSRFSLLSMAAGLLMLKPFVKMRTSLAACAAILFTTSIGGAQAILDQSYFPTNPDIYAVNFGGSHGQTFTCSLAGSLTGVEVFIARNSFQTVGDISWAVRATQFGVPVQGVGGVLASGTFPYANLDVSYTWQSILIAAGMIPVRPGVVLAITLSSDQMFTWPGQDADPYRAGSHYSTDGTGDSAWAVDVGVDLAFKTFVQPPEPEVRLAISRLGGTSARITWPTNSAGYTLEHSTTFPVAGWSTVTNAVVTSGDLFVVTVNTEDSKHFYRLRKP